MLCSQEELCIACQAENVIWLGILLWLEDGAFVWGPEHGQRFVWFEYPTGTEGGSHHVFVLDFLTSLPRYGTERKGMCRD